MLPASLVSGDKERVCPYDPTHVILAKSFDAHLMKCRENHKGSKMKTCPLDHTHVVPAPELHYHISECTKRSLMDRELQKRAGDNSLKGDVYGPPIVADHGAGQDAEENWDDAPKRSHPTPALFNAKVQNATPEAYGITQGGGYAIPKAREPVIRKIPKTPGMAASLSNPMASAPIRPNRNQVFEFSVGNQNRATNGSNNNIIRPNNRLPSAPAYSTSVTGMAGVRPMAPTNVGPRFIGRGISKYATKNNETPAAATPVPLLSLFPLPASKEETDLSNYQTGFQTNYQSGYQSSVTSMADQFGDKSDMDSERYVGLKTNETATTSKSDSSVCVPNSTVQQNNAALSSSTSLASTYSTYSDPSLDVNNAASSLQSRQFAEILLNQQRLQEKMEKLDQQQVQLKNKHETQLIDLKKLQVSEEQSMVLEKERLKHDLLLQSQVLQQMMPSLTPTTTAASYYASSSNSEEWMRGMGHMANGKSVSSPPGLSSVGYTSSDNAEIKKIDVNITKESIEKKLREIYILEQRTSLGHILSSEETNKLNSKDSLTQQLSSLQLE